MAINIFLRNSSKLTYSTINTLIRRFNSSLGSGAGKGGGSGGSIRDAGGSMGKRQAALEEGYFYKQQREQLEKLKKKIETLEREIKKIEENNKDN